MNTSSIHSMAAMYSSMVVEKTTLPVVDVVLVGEIHSMALHSVMVCLRDVVVVGSWIFVFRLLRLTPDTVMER